MKRIAQLLAPLALLAACRGEQAPTASIFHAPTQAVESRTLTTEQQRDLATLISVTTPFQKFDKAKAAGWGTQITSCMSTPEGGMGFHYGNTSLFDANVRVDSPEVLLYEPQPNGILNLVAVEYIVPYTAHSRSAAPPVLFGHQFTQNDAFQLWGLHVWAWKNNPNGIFSPWNTQVSCLTAQSGMRH
jgi:hypothetical protein